MYVVEFALDNPSPFHSVDTGLLEAVKYPRLALNSWQPLINANIMGVHTLGSREILSLPEREKSDYML